MEKKLNIGLIGHKFMGKAHSHAYRDVDMFFDLPAKPVMKVVCGVEKDIEDVYFRYGWENYTHDWKEVVHNPEIDVIDICTPDNTHFEIAMEAARYGKHIICEKPMALNLEEAKAMYESAMEKHITTMVNFTYRGVPAIRLAKQIIDEGKIGKIYHFNAFYQQDFCLNENFPFVWRMDKNLAGAGTMADKGSHILDLARFLVGELDEVACKSETFIKKRKMASTEEICNVTANDAAVFIGSFKNGALGLFETSNMSAGHKNALKIEITGSNGSINFDLERLNELEVYFEKDENNLKGFRKILVTEPTHPYIKNWWPSGHVIGWEHTFVHQIYEFICAVSENRQITPSFYDGMKCQEIVDAIANADENKKWVKINNL